MRKVVMGMMTTLNGRLDDPDAWATGVPDDLFAELDRLYGTFDTILVGRTTYDEMFEYWPGAETDEDGSEPNRSMARKMNSYKKYVFTGPARQTPLEWNNAELVLVRGDEEIAAFVNDLKAQSGGDIHLSGGARLARTLDRPRPRRPVPPVGAPGRVGRLELVRRDRREARDEAAQRDRLLERRRRPLLRAREPLISPR